MMLLVHTLCWILCLCSYEGLEPSSKGGEKKKNNKSLLSVCKVSLGGGSMCLGSLRARWKTCNPQQCLALKRNNTLPSVMVLYKGVSWMDAEPC